VTVLLGVVAFTLVMLTLVGVLLAARAILVPAGPVQIVINGGSEHDLTPRAGSTLLDTLGRVGIFLPSACGGRGTCGACLVRLVEGGGALLPTEAAHIGRGDARAGWRLACQLKVREDLSLEIPPEILAARRFQCRVRSNRNVGTFIKEIVLDLPDAAALEFRAGAYVQVECPPYELSFTDFDIGEGFRADWDRYGLWGLESKNTGTVTRAYSMANHPQEKGVVILNVRIATPTPGSTGIPPGVVSSYLFNLDVGDPVTVLGPFGHFLAEESDREMVFVGGGAGMAPMRSHIFDQLVRIRTDRKISFWYGARSLRESFYVEEFDRLADEHANFTWHLALSEPLSEDDWTGYTGLIHQVLYRNYLKDHPAPEEVEYYLCGPPMMIQACLKMLDDLGVDAESIRFDDFGE